MIDSDKRDFIGEESRCHSVSLVARWSTSGKGQHLGPRPGNSRPSGTDLAGVSFLDFLNGEFEI